jgi:hypothetical protein
MATKFFSNIVIDSCLLLLVNYKQCVRKSANFDYTFDEFCHLPIISEIYVILSKLLQDLKAVTIQVFIILI